MLQLIVTLFIFFSKILKIISPILPHVVAECIKDLKINEELSWPKIDEKYLTKEIINIVIQINGKKRGTLQTNKDISEENLIEEIKKNQTLEKIFQNKTINKTFFVKNRLINFLIS